MMYPLVSELASTGARVRVPVAVTCRVLGFSQQGYYQWLRRPRSAREIEETHLISVLRELHAEDPEGGYRVLADDPHDLGYQISERRVWRLCKVAGLQSVISKRRRRYYRAGAPVGDDLVQRGYPEGVIVHSDRGGQFRSRRFQQALQQHNLRGSMGRVGVCGDNAAMESFLSLLQNNVLDREAWATREELRLAIVHWIEARDHRKRRQRGLGKLTPVEYEAIMMDAVGLAAYTPDSTTPSADP